MRIEELVEVKKWEWRVETTRCLQIIGGGICGIDEFFMVFKIFVFC